MLPALACCVVGARDVLGAPFARPARPSRAGGPSSSTISRVRVCDRRAADKRRTHDRQRLVVGADVHVNRARRVSPAVVSMRRNRQENQVSIDRFQRPYSSARAAADPEPRLAPCQLQPTRQTRYTTIQTIAISASARSIRGRASHHLPHGAWARPTAVGEALPGANARNGIPSRRRAIIDGVTWAYSGGVCGGLSGEKGERCDWTARNTVRATRLIETRPSLSDSATRKTPPLRGFSLAGR